MGKNIKYTFFCNFCGTQFEVSRWDAKTCSHECRTRLARLIKFSDGADFHYCVICSKLFVVSEERNITCGTICENIRNDMKKYGMIDEIAERVKEAVRVSKKKEKKKESGGVLEKIMENKEKK